MKSYEGMMRSFQTKTFGTIEKEETKPKAIRFLRLLVYLTLRLLCEDAVLLGLVAEQILTACRNRSSR